MGSSPAALTACAALAIVAAIVAKKFRSLDGWGVASALLIAFTLILADVRLFVLMLLFFSSSSAFTLLGYGLKEKKGAAERKGGRGAAQVLGSGAVPTILAVIPLALGGEWEGVLKQAAVAAMAYSAADTWASEIGPLSRGDPVLITSPRTRVPAGVSGGVTMLGELAALAGSAFMAASAALLAIVDGRRAPIIFLLGWLGELVDAVLGALLQAKYLCPACGVLSDRRVHACGALAARVSGSELVKNEVVNLITEVTISAIAIAVVKLVP